MQQQQILNEKDMLTDVLNQEKSLLKTYGSYLTEASVPALRNMIEDNLGEVAEDQYKVFEVMMQKKYYPVKPATATDIDTAIDTASKLKKEMKN